MKINRTLVNIFFVYFFLTFAVGYADFDRRAVPFANSVVCLEMVLKGQMAPPMAHRILIPYTIDFFHKVTHIPLNYSYALFRFIFYFMAFCLFHVYLKKWFDDKLAMIGTLSVIAAMPLTLTNWYSLPTDMPELITFILGVMWIKENKYRRLLFLIPIATLNKETTIALVLLYFLNGLGSQKPRPLIMRTAAYFLLWLIPYAIVGIKFGIKTWPTFFGYLQHNCNGLLEMFRRPNPYNNYYFFLYLCGFYWVLAFKDFGKKDPLLRKGALIMLLHFLYGFVRVGCINEVRIFLTFFVYIIPLGLASLFKTNELSKG